MPKLPEKLRSPDKPATKEAENDFVLAAKINEIIKTKDQQIADMQYMFRHTIAVNLIGAIVYAVSALALITVLKVL